MIEGKNLSFSYKKNFVFENINFKIEKGDFVAFVGPNGAGKSTLIKLILGLLKPKAGLIKVFGKNISLLKDKHHIGYVPQRVNIEKGFPATVDEILSLKKSNKKEEVIKDLDIDNYIHKKYIDLSGGQQQRVLIALALLSNPKLLILDEPTVGVDMKTQKKFYETLKKINNRGMTIILVTHDVGVIPSVAKKVMCINHNICCMGHAKDTHKLLGEIYEEDLQLHHHHHDH